MFEINLCNHIPKKYNKYCENKIFHIPKIG